MKNYQDYPLYTIGVVSELLGLNPETIRLLEKGGIIQSPYRRSGKRFYSEKDLMRLKFVQKLTYEGLTRRAIIYYLRLYPCWKTYDCTACKHSSKQVVSIKPCWQIEGSYCQVASLKAPCANCSAREKGPICVEDKEPDILSGHQIVKEEI
ncbi:MerR family transcriptional regulator [Chloroflexota bacterium]